jgi:hypothetical protein
MLYIYVIYTYQNMYKSDIYMYTRAHTNRKILALGGRKKGAVWGVGQERLGPSYFLISV